LNFRGHPRPSNVTHQRGWLGVACVSATTVPTATQAAATTAKLIRKVRTRRCFAGAIAAPLTRDPEIPVPFTAGAAAVPTGLAAPF
jgi:hypothetical protein